ncbi:hypothetical protein VNO78_21453 [Psophocarpus tetragonolobus]|uniref:Uncharacterized protein n=1 Tax=Psophocarpus tetragonolobus TaxID=3891 RepID=A0AAN9SFC1_PSOTE
MLRIRLSEFSGFQAEHVDTLPVPFCLLHRSLPPLWNVFHMVVRNILIYSTVDITNEQVDFTRYINDVKEKSLNMMRMVETSDGRSPRKKLIKLAFTLKMLSPLSLNL